MNVENLTKGIVNLKVPPSPLDGYQVVVFENIKKGRKFKTILNPGDRPLKALRLFSNQPPFTCYAVSMDRNLTFKFKNKMTLQAQYQHFFLDATVYYYVSDSKLVALAFETDPIKRIREEMITSFQTNVLENRILLKEIHEYSSIIKEKILPNTTLNTLRDFSGELGIMIRNITITFNIPEEYKWQLKSHMRKKLDLDLNHDLTLTGTNYKLREADSKNELNLKNTFNQQEIKNVESSYQFNRDMMDVMKEKIANTDLLTTSSAEMKKNLEGIIEGAKMVSNEFQVTSEPLKLKQLPAAEDENRVRVVGSLPAPGSIGPFNDIKQFLSDLQAQVNKAYTPQEDKDAMLTYISHLLTEIRLGTKADTDIIKKYSEKISAKIDLFSRYLSFDVMEREGRFKDQIIELFNGSEV